MGREVASRKAPCKKSLGEDVAGKELTGRAAPLRVLAARDAPCVGREIMVRVMAYMTVAPNTTMLRIKARVENWLKKVPATPYCYSQTMAPLARY